eukprot:TRINITY_DN21903_c0_g1_i1.p1 TRINITY_DN21903_c0_g1~~TRINITY_DN21903_c0_g1_i1.p1  ORF type:complete len:421 (+),score=69.19 TRINITY_DN21903_c0_g1_i1:328-1590(+)
MKASSIAAVMLLAVTHSMGQECGCTSVETCCMDSAGYACCLNDETVCVQEGGGYPARCCERWTVGCGVGSVGCCDPARAYQRMFESNEKVTSTKYTPPSTQASNSTFYALFQGGVESRFEVSTINSLGHVTHKKSVTGPAKTWIDSLYGESTRVFPFDSKNKMFHFLDGSERTHPTLFSISVNGSSTSTELKSVTGYPLGFAFHAESGVLIFSTLKYSEYTFYEVEPLSGTTSLIGTSKKGSSEQDEGFYAGYISGVALEKSSIFRVGYQTVSSQTGSGMGVTNMKNGVSVWRNVSVPASDYFYYSVDRMVGSDSYVSLAPTKAGDHSFDVVLWNTTTSTVIGHAANSHPPSFREGNLGYIATAQLGSTFGGIIVYHESSEVHLWSLLTADLGSKQVTNTPLSPTVLSGTTSISGFGICN